MKGITLLTYRVIEIKELVSQAWDLTGYLARKEGKAGAHCCCSNCDQTALCDASQALLDVFFDSVSNYSGFVSLQASMFFPVK